MPWLERQAGRWGSPSRARVRGAGAGADADRLVLAASIGQLAGRTDAEYLQLAGRTDAECLYGPVAVFSPV